MNEINKYVNTISDCKDCTPNTQLNDVWSDLTSKVSSGFDKLVGNTSESVNKAAQNASQAAAKANDLMTEFEQIRPYVKPAFIVVGTTLMTLWITDIYLNIREIKRK